MTHLDMTGYSLAPRQFSTAGEVAENARRVMAFRQKGWAPPVQPKIVKALVEPKPEPKKLTRPELARSIDPFIPPVDFPRVSEIQRICCAHFQISMNDLISGRKAAPLVAARHVAMYLAKTLTPHSFPEIGRRFGGRDHTTAIWAVRKIERLKDSDPLIADAIARIGALLALAGVA